MWRALAVVVAITSPALSDDFADRWPRAAAADPVPVIAKTAPAKTVRHRGCHRQYFHRGHHRYWRCRR